MGSIYHETRNPKVRGWSRQPPPGTDLPGLCIRTRGSVRQEEASDGREHRRPSKCQQSSPESTGGQEESSSWDWKGYFPAPKSVNTRGHGQSVRTGAVRTSISGHWAPELLSTRKRHSWKEPQTQRESVLRKLGRGNRARKLQKASPMIQCYIKINTQKFCEVRKDFLNLTSFSNDVKTDCT